MRKLWLFVLLIVGSADLIAHTLPSGRGWVNLGYRRDQFEWSIAGPHGSPDVLSELQWRNLHMLTMEFGGWHSEGCIPYVRWHGSYSAIMRGSVKDSDYLESGRRCEFLRTVSRCNRGSVLEGTAGCGWPFFFCTCIGDIQLAPVIGVSWHQQLLHLDGGCEQLGIVRCHGQDHAFSHVHSEYRARWWGPWVGSDLFWQYNSRLAFHAAYEYHWGMSYRARGDWNMRQDLCGGFYHSANGHGWLLRLGGEFAFDCHWLFRADLSWRQWSVAAGSDQTTSHILVCNKKGDLVGVDTERTKIPFNGAFWHSFAASLGLAYRY